MTAHLILAILALICFGAAAAGVAAGRINLTALGLIFLTLILAFDMGTLGG